MEKIRHVGFERRQAIEQERFTARRMVVKIGTDTITDDKDNLDVDFVDHIVDQVHVLREAGVRVAIISSGAVACGKQLLRDYSGDSVLTDQVFATRGQTMLMNEWGRSFSRYEIHTFQYLLTQNNLEHPELPLSESMKIGVPIINFNDAVSDEEMKHVEKDKDNDDIASLVSQLVDADTTVFLTQGDGVIDRDNMKVDFLGDDVERIVFTGITKGGTGGMEKKVGHARAASKTVGNVFICEGRTQDVILRIAKGEHIGTKVVAGNKE